MDNVIFLLEIVKNLKSTVLRIIRIIQFRGMESTDISIRNNVYAISFLISELFVLWIYENHIAPIYKLFYLLV